MYCILERNRALKVTIQQRDELEVVKKQLTEEVKKYEQELADAANKIEKLEQLLEGNYVVQLEQLFNHKFAYVSI